MINSWNVVFIYTQMHEAWSVLLWQVFNLREDNLIWIVKRILLWNLIRKLLHYLPKITLHYSSSLIYWTQCNHQYGLHLILHLLPGFELGLWPQSECNNWPLKCSTMNPLCLLKVYYYYKLYILNFQVWAFCTRNQWKSLQISSLFSHPCLWMFGSTWPLLTLEFLCYSLFLQGMPNSK